ncbi:hypothetical protein CCR75_006114 [Bremia lactucae]|uniref:Uncharacterized protein n=1 Tax=Bremia lactucae TaxID=4779 RepID=A0A976II09_BRELC|nr:hypothetical protein CCR75_006114 [Bremia lactucae]
MAKTDDDEALRRRGRARPRPPSSEVDASVFASIESTNQPLPRSTKMKMASLMAVVDDESKSKRAKSADIPSNSHVVRNASISISSLTSSTEAPAASLFQNEMPTIIPSFSRDAPVGNGESKRVANGSASAFGTRSMLEYCFPSGRYEGNGSSNTRSLKRKRRSGRRDESSTDVDMLPFGIDAAKLVPQGLVDRVDVHMSHVVLLAVVSNHVTNWCNRSGFASSFFQEISTLLAAYYPCNYSTLLDEVFARFLFKRPEFIDLLLPAMLEKMSKAGDSVTTTKYPVADALVRSCGVSCTLFGPLQARHDLACLTLLQCLVEYNRGKFPLTSWIVSCAFASSDRVLLLLWKALLLCIEDDDKWHIEEPMQQIVELLAEEDKRRDCRISCGFVKLVLSNDFVRKELVESRSYLIVDCLLRAFEYASPSWSASLMAEWLERRRKQQSDVTGSLKELLDFLVCSNWKLSLKKPEWFVNHLLRFLLSPQCHEAEHEETLGAILHDHMRLVFGFVDATENRQNSGSESLGAAARITWTELDAVGSQSILELQHNIELLIGLLQTAKASTSAAFFKLWSKAWSDKEKPLYWNQVYALFSVILKNTIEDRSEFGQKLECLTISVCKAYYSLLDRQTATHNSRDDMARKYSETLSLLLPSKHLICGILLQEVLNALVHSKLDFAKSCSLFGNVVILHLRKCFEGNADVSLKQCSVEKCSVEYDHAQVASTTTTADLLTMLQSLVLKEDDVGDFTRHVLSSGPVMRVLVRLLNLSRQRRRQEMLLDVMNVVVRSANGNQEWSRQYVVLELVHCAYTGPLISAKKAVALLESIFRHSSNDICALMWMILKQCTKRCCGCEVQDNVVKPALLHSNYQIRADTFAELVKAMVLSIPANAVCEVRSFVEQKLSSCFIGKTRINLFLLLLLRKLVVCEHHCGVFLPVVQLAICPLASSNFEQIRLIQLQLLKVLCTRLVTINCRSVALHKAEVWKRYEILVCNERLQTDLRQIINASSGVYSNVERISRASIVLAQNILTLTDQLRNNQCPSRRRPWELNGPEDKMK